MKRFVCILFLLFISFASGRDIERYHRVRLMVPDAETARMVLRLGISLEGALIKTGYFWEVVVSDSELGEIQSLGMTYELVQEDLQDYYLRRLSRRAPGEFGDGSMGGYYTYDEMVVQLDSIHALMPSISTEKFSIGSSYEGRTIYAIKISDNPEVDEDEPELLLTGMHHAREPISMMNLLFYLYYIAERYGTDPEVTYLVNNRELFVVPIVNPDGYVYNQEVAPAGGGMHRKNRHPNGCSGTGIGVDLNRNYGYMWGYDDVGSSPDPCSETYRGTSAFSEDETQTLRDFVLQHDFKIVNNYHTYSDLILYPFGYDPDVYPPAEDSLYYRHLGAELSRLTGYVHGTAPELLYSTNGDANDWMYGEEGIFAITMEVGNYSDGFWPPSDRILPLCEEVLPANLYLTWVAGEHISVRDSWFTWEGDYPDPGETGSLSLIIQNDGLSDMNQELSFTLSTNLNGITISDTLITLNQLPARSEITLEDITQLQLSTNLSPGQKAVLYIDLHYPGNVVLEDSLTFIIGTPEVVLDEGFEDGLDNWDTGSGWGLTQQAYDGTYAITDSPEGDYQNQSENVLTYSEPIDLSEVSQAILRFATKWDIEAGWDFATVEVSVNNGLSWQPVSGKFTHPGNGQGVQPDGLPGYDGQQSEWVLEEMNLADWIGYNNLKLRFALRSDVYVTGDGWYLDDIQLLTYPIPQVTSGDVNNDGEVNVLDIIRVVGIILNTYSNPSPQELEAADVNGDGVINVSDVVLLVVLILNQS